MRGELPFAQIWTDGSVAGKNPSRVGCGAAIVRMMGRDREFVRVETSDTETVGNGRMEMLACLAGLEIFGRPTRIDLYSDAQFISQAFIQNWVANWEKNGWTRRNRKNRRTEDIPNADLWQKLVLLDLRHDIAWHHVKGHAGDEYNERVHRLAKRTAREEFERMENPVREDRNTVNPAVDPEVVAKLLAELPDTPMPEMPEEPDYHYIVDTKGKKPKVSVMPCTMSEDEKADGGKTWCEKVAFRMNEGRGNRFQVRRQRSAAK